MIRDIAVSEDGVIMMVTYQFVDGSDTTSYVAFYNFGDVGQNEDDRIVSGYKYEGVVVPQIQYLDNNRSVALKDNGFTIYHGSQIPKEAKTVKGKPTVLIANTIKGCGSSVMEDKAAWHHHVPNAEEYDQIMKDLEARKEAALNE